MQKYAKKYAQSANEYAQYLKNLQNKYAENMQKANLHNMQEICKKYAKHEVHANYATIMQNMHLSRPGLV